MRRTPMGRVLAPEPRQAQSPMGPPLGIWSAGVHGWLAQIPSQTDRRGFEQAETRHPPMGNVGRGAILAYTAAPLNGRPRQSPKRLSGMAE